MLTPARISAPTLKIAQKVGSPSRLASLAQALRITGTTRPMSASRHQSQPISRAVCQTRLQAARGQAGEALRELRRASSYDSTTRSLATFRPLTSDRLGGPDRIKKNA